MMLTSFFRRDHWLILLAAIAGLVAQEVVTRTTAADADTDSSFEVSSISPSWVSMEAFYGGDARAHAAFAVRASEPPADALAISMPEVQPRVVASVEQDRPYEEEPTWVTSGIREADGGLAADGVLAAVEAAPELVADAGRSEPQRGEAGLGGVEVLPAPVEAGVAAVAEEPGESVVESALDSELRPLARAGTQRAVAAELEESREPTPSELRQQRAWERSQARRARMEAYRDMGHCPSRPVVSPSRHVITAPSREIVLVPIVVSPSPAISASQVR